jgi:nucleoside-diphosphate-sugar epimerase
LQQKGAFMSDPLIAMTGSTGFIGRYLLRELTRRKYRVRVLLRRPTALSMEFGSAVIGDLMRPQNMSAALAGADAVIHTAGLSPVMSGMPEDDYRALNTAATIALAQAAERAGIRRFIFMSSLRAQAGVTNKQVLTEDAPARPTDPYGRSKLAAELALAELGLDWVALRLALVYGPGATGNMARLMQLARSPYPLPLGGLRARRSLLSLDNLVEAIACVLAVPQPLARPLIVAEPQPLTIPEMIAAMRRALGRRPALVSVPSQMLKFAFLVSGRAALFERLSAPLVADATALLQLGWQPQTSAVGLQHWMGATGGVTGATD